MSIYGPSSGGGVETPSSTALNKIATWGDTTGETLLDASGLRALLSGVTATIAAVAPATIIGLDAATVNIGTAGTVSLLMGDGTGVRNICNTGAGNVNIAGAASVTSIGGSSGVNLGGSQTTTGAILVVGTNAGADFINPNMTTGSLSICTATLSSGSVTIGRDAASGPINLRTGGLVTVGSTAGTVSVAPNLLSIGTSVTGGSLVIGDGTGNITLVNGHAGAIFFGQTASQVNIGGAGTIDLGALTVNVGLGDGANTLAGNLTTGTLEIGDASLTGAGRVSIRQHMGVDLMASSAATVANGAKILWTTRTWEPEDVMGTSTDHSTNGNILLPFVGYWDVMCVFAADNATSTLQIWTIAASVGTVENLTEWSSSRQSVVATDINMNNLSRLLYVSSAATIAVINNTGATLTLGTTALSNRARIVIRYVGARA